MFLEKRSGLRGAKTNLALLSRNLLLLAAGLSLLWSVYFALVTISIPYQLELREGTAQVMTELLLSRSNPFQFEHQPLAMNNYGIGYNVAVLPLAALFGNTLAVHRSVTFLFVLLSGLAGFVVVYQARREISSASACAAFIILGLMARGGIGAFPSAMGSFLFILTLVVPFLKGFDRTGLFLSVLFSIAAFYSKPYFVLGVGIVALYIFLFVSRRNAVFYSLLFLVLFAFSVAAVRLTLPLYFINTVVGNISNTDRSLAHLLSQLVQLLVTFLPVLGSSFLLLASQLDSLQRPAVPAAGTGGWRGPLIAIAPDYFLFSSVCALLAFIFVLGSHIGNYLSYTYQLIVPVFFCWFFRKFDSQKQMSLLITAAVMFNLFFWGKDTLHPDLLSQKNSEEWQQLYSYVSSASNILNSPAIASMVIEADLNPLDSGQTAYFYSVKPYPPLPLLGPPYEQIQTDGFRYIRFIDNSIQKQRFDLIVTTREEGTFYHAKWIEKFYTPVEEIKLDMPQTGQQWTVLLWKPTR